MKNAVHDVHVDRRENPNQSKVRHDGKDHPEITRPYQEVEEGVARNRKEGTGVDGRPGENEVVDEHPKWDRYRGYGYQLDETF